LIDKRSMDTSLTSPTSPRRSRRKDFVDLNRIDTEKVGRSWKVSLLKTWIWGVFRGYFAKIIAYLGSRVVYILWSAGILSKMKAFGMKRCHNHVCCSSRYGGLHNPALVGFWPLWRDMPDQWPASLNPEFPFFSFNPCTVYFHRVLTYIFLTPLVERGSMTSVAPNCTRKCTWSRK